MYIGRVVLLVKPRKGEEKKEKKGKKGGPSLSRKSKERGPSVSWLLGLIENTYRPAFCKVNVMGDAWILRPLFYLYFHRF